MTVSYPAYLVSALYYNAIVLVEDIVEHISPEDNIVYSSFRIRIVSDISQEDREFLLQAHAIYFG